jgi:hypothetical protein
MVFEARHNKGSGNYTVTHGSWSSSLGTVEDLGDHCKIYVSSGTTGNKSVTATYAFSWTYEEKSGSESPSGTGSRDVEIFRRPSSGGVTKDSSPSAMKSVSASTYDESGKSDEDKKSAIFSAVYPITGSGDSSDCLHAKYTCIGKIEISSSLYAKASTAPFPLNLFDSASAQVRVMVQVGNDIVFDVAAASTTGSTSTDLSVGVGGQAVSGGVSIPVTWGLDGAAAETAPSGAGYIEGSGEHAPGTVLNIPKPVNVSVFVKVEKEDDANAYALGQGSASPASGDPFTFQHPH